MGKSLLFDPTNFCLLCSSACKKSRKEYQSCFTFQSWQKIYINVVAAGL